MGAGWLPPPRARSGPFQPPLGRSSDRSLADSRDGGLDHAAADEFPAHGLILHHALRGEGPPEFRLGEALLEVLLREVGQFPDLILLHLLAVLGGEVAAPGPL